jgi:hypothetical protein
VTFLRKLVFISHARPEDDELPDMSPEDIMAVIEKVEARKAELMAVRPEAKQQAKLLRAPPAAAKQYREQITKGFQAT